MFSISDATEMLEEHMQNKNLRRHCLSVGKVLAAFYDYYKQNGVPGKFATMGDLTRDQWEIVGILHDADWELTTKDETNHTKVLLEWVKDKNLPEEMLDAFRTHNNKVTGLKDPTTLLEWTMECADELTGFIVAVCLILPSKKLSDVTVESVIKKFGQKDFSRAVHREQITQCEEKIGITINDFISVTLKAMQDNHELLGL